MKTVTIELTDKEYKDIARKAKAWEMSEAKYLKTRYIIGIEEIDLYLKDIIDDKIFSSDYEDEIRAIGEEINDIVDMKVEEAIEYYEKEERED